MVMDGVMKSVRISDVFIDESFKHLDIELIATLYTARLLDE